MVSLKQAVENIKASHPGEAAVIEAAIRKDIIALGTDEAFALRDAEGEGQIRAFKQGLTLSVAAGTLIQPVPGGPYVVSAQGYEVWQEAVGASVIFPKEVLVDGQWQQNPAVIRDPHNRRILCIYARAVAFKFSSKGIPQVSDWTTIFDTPSYRMIDLLGKAKKFPQAFRLFPTSMGEPPKEGEKDKSTWASYPFDESTALWVNTAHEEALSWFAQILNREKKAIDFAQTFAKRNALKHLSGLQKAPGAEWKIAVLCWRPTNGNIVKWDATTYANLREAAGKLIASGGDGFETRKIEAKEGAERVSDEAGVDELEKQTDPEDQTDIIDIEPVSVEKQEEAKKAEQPRSPETTATTPSKEVPNMTEEEKRTAINYKEAQEQFKAEYAEACKSLRLNPKGTHNIEQMTAIVKKISEILDQF